LHIKEHAITKNQGLFLATLALCLFLFVSNYFVWDKVLFAQYKFLPLHLINPLSIALFIFCVVKLDFASKLFTHQVPKAIGIMSYTIYLWHYMIISVVGALILPYCQSKYFILNLIGMCVVIVPVVLIICTILFYSIERPCMHSTLAKKWQKQLRRK
jgi:peptidoglycan/LPS O-acetylase OafA/YrhL